jgi:hypothetical protein
MAAANPGRLHAPEGGQVGRPEAHPLHSRAGRGDLLEVDDAERGLEDRVHEERALQPGLCLELRQQSVDVVDVPRPLDLGHHDHLELVADLGHESQEVIERPGALERVDAGPERGIPEVGRLGDLDQALASRLLSVGGDRVLQFAEQDVRLRGHLRNLGGHLLVRGVEEVDHPRGLDRDLDRRLGGADGERMCELARVSHCGLLRSSLAIAGGIGPRR